MNKHLYLCHLLVLSSHTVVNDAFISSLLFLYHKRMFTKRTLYGYWGCQSLHNCQYSVFPKITDTYSVPLHIFQMEVEVNPQSFRENEGKIDPILYLVGIVRCQTVLI